MVRSVTVAPNVPFLVYVESVRVRSVMVFTVPELSISISLNVYVPVVGGLNVPPVWIDIDGCCVPPPVNVPVEGMVSVKVPGI